MGMPQALTRQMLDEWGVVVKQISENEYEIYENGKLKKQKISYTHHKYGQEKPYIGTNYKGKPRSLARTVYAYFIGDVPAGMDVDHIDNDPFNNRLDNLQILTRKENLRKRPLVGANQWKRLMGYSDEEWIAMVQRNKEKKHIYGEERLGWKAYKRQHPESRINYKDFINIVNEIIEDAS